MSGAKKILLAAGGTGGHLFPAEALACVLIARGYDVDLVTDARASQYGGMFDAAHLHIVPSETLRSKSPLALARTAGTLALGLGKALMLMRLAAAAMPASASVCRCCMPAVSGSVKAR